MPYITNMISKDKMQDLIETLSRFDKFSITTDKSTEFGATEIVSHMDDFLEFRRLFATSVYSDDALTGIERLENGNIVCKTSGTTYTIHPLRQKLHETVTHDKRRWNTVTDLMDLSYIGKELNIYIRELDMMILTVDPYLLGNLSITEQAQIKRIINVFLDGKGRSMQMCRTVCFQVRLNDDRNRIYAGIYDLERGCSVTSKQIFEECMSEVISEDVLAKCRAFLSYAKQLEKNIEKVENRA